MKQPYEQGKRMNFLHGLYDEQMGQQVTGVYSYAEIGRMIGGFINTVNGANSDADNTATQQQKSSRYGNSRYKRH